MGGRICSITAGPTILYMRVGLEGRTSCYYYKATQLVYIQFWVRIIARYTT